jgi:hypothetical protein
MWGFSYVPGEELFASCSAEVEKNSEPLAAEEIFQLLES